MSRNPSLREKYLDGEKLFRKYWEMGEGRSIALLIEWAKLQGMVSSRGNEPTQMGVWKAMWRWASLVENRDRAFAIVYAALGAQITWGDYVRDMIHIKIPTAWQHPTIAKRDKFLRDNGWV